MKYVNCKIFGYFYSSQEQQNIIKQKQIKAVRDNFYDPFNRVIVPTACLISDADTKKGIFT